MRKIVLLILLTLFISPAYGLDIEINRTAWTENYAGPGFAIKRKPNSEDYTLQIPQDLGEGTASGDKYFIYDTSARKVKTIDHDDLPSGGGSGDVTGVGDCGSGACFDGTSDGGSYVRIYDGDSHYGEIQVPNVAGNTTYTLPATTSTLLATDGDGSSLTNVDAATGDSATDFFDAGEIADARIVDTITASNYLLLAGGALTGNLDLDDGVTNSPVMKWTDQANEVFNMHKNNTGSFAMYMNTADTETIAVTNEGAGAMNFTVDGTISEGGTALASKYEAIDAAITKSDEVETISANWVNTANPWADNEVADDITASNYLPLTGGTLTGELVADNLGIEFTAGDDHSDCTAFSATGGGIFFDDSEGIFKKCQDNVLTDLDTGAGSVDKISEGDSFVEVIDSGTGEVLIDVDDEDLEIKDGGANQINFTSNTGVDTIDFNMTLQATAMTLDGAASPYSKMRDSDAVGAAVDDEDIGGMAGNMSSTTEDSEVSDIWFTFMSDFDNPSIEDTWFAWDGSAFTMYLGLTENSATIGTAIANYENLTLDFDTATDNEVAVGTTSGVTNIDFGSIGLETSGVLALNGDSITSDGVLVINATSATSFNDEAITNVSDISLDSVSADGATITVGDSDEETIVQADGLPDADDTYSCGMVLYLTAGGAVAQWDLVAMQTDGKVDAANATMNTVIGFAVEETNDGWPAADTETIGVCMLGSGGSIRNDGWTGHTAGELVYVVDAVDATAGTFDPADEIDLEDGDHWTLVGVMQEEDIIVFPAPAFATDDGT